MKARNMIRLSSPPVTEEDIRAVSDVLRSRWLVQGKNVEAFEADLALYLEVRHAVAVSSGTAALHLALLAMGISPGDEVILPALTFPATANVVELTGARSVLVDIDPQTFNIDPEKIEERITSRTKAIMPVHLAGQPAEMKSILALARRHGIPVLEDAAGALGAQYGKKKCGSMGRVGCFSFHPRKVITTGEGGLIATSRKDLAEKARCLRNHGQKLHRGRRAFHMAGFNYRMTEMAAAMGRVQLSGIENLLAGNTERAETYRRLLSDFPGLETPFHNPANRHVYQVYTVLLPPAVNRDRLIVRLRERGIECSILTFALHLEPYYRKKYGLKPGDFPNAHSVFRRSLALPFSSALSGKDMAFVSATLKETLTKELERV